MEAEAEAEAEIEKRDRETGFVFAPRAGWRGVLCLVCVKQHRGLRAWRKHPKID
jgi:hypothetical protein